MALGTRAGYIKDYIRGDGYQLSRRELNRDSIAQMRGVGKGIGLERGNDTLARTGNWHNAFITTMHHLGIVGCALTYLMELLGLFLFMRLAAYYRGKPFFACFCALYGTSFVLLKLLYTLLAEEGKVSPLALRRTYVPMLIQEASASGTSGNRVTA